MVYTPPRYQKLQKDTVDLLTSFNAISKRYDPLSYDIICNKLDLLEAKYLEEAQKKAKSSWILSSDVKKRLDQIACITQLKNNLIREGDEATRPQRQKILLGSIFYREARLKKQYEPYRYFRGRKNCALYQILNREFYLDSVDWQTRAECYQAYLDYLDQEGVKERFQYIKDNPSYIEDLKTYTASASRKAKPIGAQLKVLRFIQTLGTALLSTDKLLSEHLDAISRAIDIRIESLDEEGYIENSEIILLIKSLKLTEKDKKFIEEMLPSVITKKGIAVETSEGFRWISFTEYMEQKIIVTSKYALMGAYALSLKKFHGMVNLVKVLENVICDSKMNAIDEKNSQIAFRALKKYLIYTEEEVDFSAWNPLIPGEDRMPQSKLEIQQRGESALKRELENQLLSREIVREEKEEDVLTLIP